MWKNILICKIKTCAGWISLKVGHHQVDRGLWSFVLQRHCCYTVSNSFSEPIQSTGSLEGASTWSYFLRIFHAFPEERNSDLHEIPIFYNSPMVREPRRKSLPWRYRRKYEFVETWSWDGLVPCWLLESSSMGTVNPRDSAVCVFFATEATKCLRIFEPLGQSFEKITIYYIIYLCE